jgi:hypothetical protein
MSTNPLQKQKTNHLKKPDYTEVTKKIKAMQGKGPINTKQKGAA